MPIKIPSTRISQEGRELSCSERMRKVVKMAPRVIWPSMPMFHSPAEKVASRPALTVSKGTQVTSTLAILSLELKAPSRMLEKTSSGLARASRRTMVVKTSARMTAPKRKPRSSHWERFLSILKSLAANQLAELVHRGFHGFDGLGDLAPEEDQDAVAVAQDFLQVR